MHGPHHSAHRSTTTGISSERSSTSAWNVASVTSIPDAAAGADVDASSSDGGNVAGKAVDGDRSTRWESAHGVDEVDYTIDLGRLTDVDTMRVDWENAAAARYVLQVRDTADDPLLYYRSHYGTIVRRPESEKTVLGEKA